MCKCINLIPIKDENRSDMETEVYDCSSVSAKSLSIGQSCLSLQVVEIMMENVSLQMKVTFVVRLYKKYNETLSL